MTRWKYWIVANFYLTSFLFHPGRVFRILVQLLPRASETSKMESFLHETSRKFRLRSARSQARVFADRCRSVDRSALGAVR